MVLAGFLQAAVQWPALRRDGFRFRWVSPWGDPTVREVVRRMAPAVLGVAAYQVNVVVTQAIAYREAEEVVASFNYAIRLLELPQGVVGVSLAFAGLAEFSVGASAVANGGLGDVPGVSEVDRVVLRAGESDVGAASLVEDVFDVANL